ncbi:MAG: ATP-dependent DNA helicase RecG [Chloroflexi bacterium]|nr:ATP-dependent DNA helicase RecG [Chloroflexota bacterium]
MSSSLEKLYKFALLEKKRNFDDRAVFGGLQEILPAWVAEARSENIDLKIIAEISEKIENYKSQSCETRSKTIEDILELIQNNSQVVPARPVAETSSYLARNIKTPMDSNQGIGRNDLIYSKMLLAPVTSITGVGESIAGKLAKLGITTIKDLLDYYPRRYDDFSNFLPINHLEFGKEVTAIGTIKSIASRPTKNPHITLTEAILTDGTGFLRLSWFNQPYLENVIKPDVQIVVSGKVDRYLGRLSLNNPEWEKLEKEQLHTNRIVPVYALTADLKQRSLRNIIYKTVNYWASRVTDYLPASICESAGLMDMQSAIFQIHFPDSMEDLRKAQHRLAFDEIFLLQMGALQQKRKWQSNTAQSFYVSDEWLQEQQEKLPYPLTSAQNKSFQEIRADLSSGIPMNRLLQGDVGSGKTIIAGLASAIIIQNGAQAAIIAPTSILAEQHYKTFQNLFSSAGDFLQLVSPDAIQILIGDTPAADREKILAGLANGEVKLLIGTHAILEDVVKFSNLQLAIIDEQHRFGVKQRAQFRSKGVNPHLLVMTATPIPRSLALTVYGDLDLSIIDELPAGRQEIETHLLHPLERERAYSLIHSQIKAGRQAFIIYPLVEEEETNEESKAAVNEYERLKNDVFSHERVGLVHGRMSQEEKDRVMAAFRDHELDVLVSTSVIEVGVDIPNATVMLIEGANRFGLAQLHQFRGRVGRGVEKSYCLLVPETIDAVENERLIVMASTNDGFVLAERDLSQRGPGEFLGVRQSGYSNLRMASLSNIKLIEQARYYAGEVFKSDPDLENPAHRNIKPLIQFHWNEGQGDIS